MCAKAFRRAAGTCETRRACSDEGAQSSQGLVVSRCATDLSEEKLKTYLQFGVVEPAVADQAHGEEGHDVNLVPFLADHAFASSLAFALAVCRSTASGRVLLFPASQIGLTLCCPLLWVVRGR